MSHLMQFDHPPTGDAAIDAYLESLRQRGLKRDTNASVLLHEYMIMVVNTQMSKHVDPRYLLWFLIERVLTLQLLEANTTIAYETRKANAVVIQTVLQCLQEAIDTQASSIPAEALELLDGGMQAAIDDMLMRIVFKHIEDEDLTYGGAVPAPLKDATA